MSLLEQILEMQKEFMAQVPEETVKTMMAATEKLIQSGVGKKCLKTGDTMPEFSLPGATGKTVSSLGLLKEGPLVINFYRGAWCPYCNLELHAFEEVLPGINELGGNLVAISPNLPDYSLTSIEKNNLSFEVLSDQGNTVAKTFGLVFTLAEELRGLYKGFGIDVPAHNGDESYELPIPATYVVQKDGTISFSFVNPDYTKRLEPSEVIRVLTEVTSS